MTHFQFLACVFYQYVFDFSISGLIVAYPGFQDAGHTSPCFSTN